MPRRIPQLEFIAMMAMIFACTAFSIDAMLPALPQIGEELTPDAPNQAQLILTIFIAGMGLGTLFTGPMSDAVGRKPVMIGGAVLYVGGSLGVFWSETLEMALIFRFLQGLGVAGPRAVGLAVVRDLYSGRDMARITSFIMMVFTLVPAIAPLLGEYIIDHTGWRGIFLAFVVFITCAIGWFTLRQSETLDPARRRPFRVATLWDGLKELGGTPVVRNSILLQILSFSSLFAMLSSVQPIYEISYDRAETFPEWFFMVSLIAGGSSLLNAWAVGRFGVRAVVRATFSVQFVLSFGIALYALIGAGPGFALFLLWQITVFFQAGLTIGNINAMGMEPVGHIAGLASSLIASLATLGAALCAIPVGLAFDGTAMPLAVGIAIFSAVAVALIRRMPRAEPAPARA